MEFCRVDRDGHLLVVTLDRPRVLNALHRGATDELDQVWTMYESDPELRVAILTGAGDRSFSVGYDMREPAAPAAQLGRGFLAHRHPRGLGALTLLPLTVAGLAWLAGRWLARGLAAHG